MPRTDRRFPRLLACATLLAALGLGRPARAQFDDDDDEPDAAAAAAQPAQRFEVAEVQFDQWAFGNARNPATARTRFESFLSMQVDEVDRICTLSDAQKQKLRLAGRGDVKRFFDLVEEKRKRFQHVRTDQAKFQEFYQELQRLQNSVQSGPFGDGSVFLKILKSTLDDDQFARYEKAARERKMFRYRAKIELAVAMADNVVGLSGDQRRRLLKLLADETRPPKKFGQYDYQVVLLQLSKLPPDKVKPIFNDRQWQLLGPQFDNARRMEPYLTKNDILPGPEADDRPAAAEKGDAR